MDTFELNKIAGAVLGAGLLIMVISEIGNVLVHPDAPEQPVIVRESAEAAPAAETAAAAEEPPIAQLMAQADAEKGAREAKKCAACHTFDKGGQNKIGPNLYGVLGRDIASAGGFSYSEALTGLEGEWTYDKIAHFITNPKAFAPGTKMAFAGVRKPDARADLLAYLRQQHDSPPPLPE